MVEFEILVEGRFATEDLVVTYTPGRTMPTDAITEAWIARVWRDRVARARSDGMPLYDGKLFRLESFGVTNEGKLLLELGDTGYKEYMATRQPMFFRGRSRDSLSNPLAVCSAIVTADDNLLVEKRRVLDVYPGRYHVIGGFLERDKDIEGHPQPFQAMRREILEETGLDIDPNSLTCLGLVYDLTTPHPELCFALEAGATFDAICRNPHKDGEVGRLEFVRNSPEGLWDFIVKNHGNISATGEPCLILYGSSRFGSEWRDALLAEIS